VLLDHDRVHVEDCADCENPKARVDRLRRRLELAGDLTAEQRSRLLEIANMCPVHRTLEGDIRIETRLVDG
jgi:putative redox protein